MALLEVRGIVKDFPGIRALDDVDFVLESGTVHALLGENGAGKSTLLKVLAGVHKATAGKLVLDGEPLQIADPQAAHAAGISVIHQEFNLIPDLTVAENIFLGREPRHGPARWINRKAMRDETAKLLEQLGVELSSDARIGDLSVSSQQMVEIAKALSFDARVIVMDEPTAALNDQETERLFNVVRQLREQGKAVIYVSHRLAEIFELADVVTVLRDGKTVGTEAVTDIDEDDLIRMMVGRTVDSVFQRDEVAAGEVVLHLEGVAVGQRVQGVSFELRAGEILGIGGLDGSGGYEILQAIFGLVATARGRMTLHGRAYSPNSPRDALAAEVGFLSSDRKGTGILNDLSITHNLTIAHLNRVRLGKTPLVDRVAERRLVERFRDRLGVRMRAPQQSIDLLSGGNQQKVMLARALASDATVLALAEPTRGVDVGAKAEIHGLLNELTAQGIAVLMLSSDLLELVGMSDRVVVMHEGQVSGRLQGDGLTGENVVAAATGRRIGVEEVSA